MQHCRRQIRENYDPLRILKSRTRIILVGLVQLRLERPFQHGRQQRGQNQPLPPLRSTLQSAPKGEALCIDHFISTDNAFGQKTLKAESSPLGEDVQRTEEVTTPPRSRTATLTAR